MKIIVRLIRISGFMSTDKPRICGMKDSPTPMTSSVPSVRCLSSFWLNQNILAGVLGE